MLALLREMRAATDVPVAAQPSVSDDDECHSFTRLPEFPNALETIQIPRSAFADFGRVAGAKASATWAAVVAATRLTFVRLPMACWQQHEIMHEHRQMRCAIGIDVGGTKCAAGLVRLMTVRSSRDRRPTRPERGGEAVLADVIEQARSLQANAKRLNIDPTSIGIGLCELVAPNGQILSNETIHWMGISVVERIST